MVLKTFYFEIFVAEMSCERDDSMNFAEKDIFPKFLGLNLLCDQILGMPEA